MESMKGTSINETPIYLTKDFGVVTEKAKDDYYKLMATPKPKK